MDKSSKVFSKSIESNEPKEILANNLPKVGQEDETFNIIDKDEENTIINRISGVDLQIPGSNQISDKNIADNDTNSHVDINDETSIPTVDLYNKYYLPREENTYCTERFPKREGLLFGNTALPSLNADIEIIKSLDESLDLPLRNEHIYLDRANIEDILEDYFRPTKDFTGVGCIMVWILTVSDQLQLLRSANISYALDDILLRLRAKINRLTIPVVLFVCVVEETFVISPPTSIVSPVMDNLSELMLQGFQPTSCGLDCELPSTSRSSLDIIMQPGPSCAPDCVDDGPTACGLDREFPFTSRSCSDMMMQPGPSCAPDCWDIGPTACGLGCEFPSTSRPSLNIVMQPGPSCAPDCGLAEVEKQEVDGYFSPDTADIYVFYTNYTRQLDSKSGCSFVVEAFCRLLVEHRDKDVDEIVTLLMAEIKRDHSIHGGQQQLNMSTDDMLSRLLYLHKYKGQHEPEKSTVISPTPSYSACRCTQIRFLFCKKALHRYLQGKDDQEGEYLLSIASSAHKTEDLQEFCEKVETYLISKDYVNLCKQCHLPVPE